MPESPGRNVIEVANLNKHYGHTVAVREVSFAVERGEIFGILGPNGAGKTTTVECIAGLRKPDGGSITVLGLPPTATELRRRVGVQLQESQLPEKRPGRPATCSRTRRGRSCSGPWCPRTAASRCCRHRWPAG
jgi:ABC-type Mn2+/Zn2+ transport system ATPase subunit